MALAAWTSAPGWGARAESRAPLALTAGPRAHHPGIRETQAWPGGKSVFNIWPACGSHSECAGGGVAAQAAQLPPSLAQEVRGAFSRTFPRNPGLAPALPLLGQCRGPWGSFLAPGPWPGGWTTSAPGGLGTHKAMDTAGLPEQGAQAQTLGQWLVPGGMRPSQRETPSPSSPGQGSSQDFDGFPDGTWVVGTGQPPGRPCLGSSSGEGPLAAAGLGRTTLEGPMAPPPHPHAPTSSWLSLTPLPGCSCWGGRPGCRFAAWALAGPQALPLSASAHAAPCPAGTCRPTTAVEGTPLPCPGSHNLCPSCTAGIRADACQPGRSCVWRPHAPSAQARPGAECGHRVR